jgi:hypothetical protein
MGNRQKPSSRKCPWCGRDGKEIRAWWQVGRARDSVVYILHFHWPEGVLRDPEDRDWLVWPDGRRVRFQADHYSGSSIDLSRRLAEHLSGRGAKLPAAALELGADVRIAREWHVPLAFEQRLRRKPSVSPQSRNGQRFGSIQLRPLCPEPGCAGEKAWGRFPEAEVQNYYREQRQLNTQERQSRREWEDHCAQLQADGIWDPWTTWDEAFPQLAYGSAAPAVMDSPAARRNGRHNGQHAVEGPGDNLGVFPEASGPSPDAPWLLGPAIDPVRPADELDQEIDL